MLKFSVKKVQKINPQDRKKEITPIPTTHKQIRETPTQVIIPKGSSETEFDRK